MHTRSVIVLLSLFTRNSNVRAIHPTSLVFFMKIDQVGAVVVGLDTSFGFRQMCVASSYIQRGALFLGTNPDVADRVGSLLMPGTGPILASIQTASGVRCLVENNFRA